MITAFLTADTAFSEQHAIHPVQTNSKNETMICNALKCCLGMCLRSDYQTIKGKVSKLGTENILNLHMMMLLHCKLFENLLMNLVQTIINIHVTCSSPIKIEIDALVALNVARCLTVHYRQSQTMEK